MRTLAALAFALAAALGAQAAPPLPAAVRLDTHGLRPLGEGRFRYFAWHVYDAALWTEGEPWSPARTYALDIRYAMAIRGADLAARSVKEMRRQGHTDEAVLARWEAAMAAIFPDIHAGDRLVGVSMEGREARFYGARGLLGVVPDADFTRAFFAIWLDPRTDAPDLRRRLLGLPE